MSLVSPELKAKVDDLIEKAEQGGLVRHMSTLLPLLKNLSVFQSVYFHQVMFQSQVLTSSFEPSLISYLHVGWSHDSVH